MRYKIGIAVALVLVALLAFGWSMLRDNGEESRSAVSRVKQTRWLMSKTIDEHGKELCRSMEPCGVMWDERNAGPAMTAVTAAIAGRKKESGAPFLLVFEFCVHEERSGLIEPMNEKTVTFMFPDDSASAAKYEVLVREQEVCKSAETQATGQESKDTTVPIGEPFRLPDLTFSIDRTFATEGVRVLSVNDRDVEVVREAFDDANDRFVEFLRERGISRDVPRHPMTIQLVPSDVLCRAEIYEEPNRASATAPSDCSSRGSWYRPVEKTLFLTEGDDPAMVRLTRRDVAAGRTMGDMVQERARAWKKQVSGRLSIAVATAICLHTTPLIELCDKALLADYAAEAQGKP